MSAAWERAKRNIHRPRHMPDMLTFDEARAVFRMSRNAFTKKLKRDFRPIGGVAWTGRPGHKTGRVLVHAWAVVYMLNMTDSCPGCGRKYPLFPGDEGD